METDRVTPHAEAMLTAADIIFTSPQPNGNCDLLHGPVRVKKIHDKSMLMDNIFSNWSVDKIAAR